MPILWKTLHNPAQAACSLHCLAHSVFLTQDGNVSFAVARGDVTLMSILNKTLRTIPASMLTLPTAIRFRPFSCTFSITPRVFQESSTAQSKHHRSVPWL